MHTRTKSPMVKENDLKNMLLSIKMFECKHVF